MEDSIRRGFYVPLRTPRRVNFDQEASSQESTVHAGASRKPERKFEAILGRRAGAIALGSNYEKCAALVDKALDGAGLPRAILENLNSHSAHMQYFIYSRLEPIWFLNLLILVLLNFVEIPLWCSNPEPYACGDPDVYLLSGVPLLPRHQTLLVEIFSLAVLGIQTFWPVFIVGRKAVFSHRIEVIRSIMWSLMCMDIIVYGFFVEGYITNLLFRLAPYLRICFVITNIVQLRQFVPILIGIFPEFIMIGSLLILYLVFFSWLALILFKGTTEETDYFYNFQHTLYEMLVLLTTANNPDVWLPAFREYRVSCIFFILFLTFGLYFILNVVLAIVYDSFKSERDKRDHVEIRKNQETLEHAFDLLDDAGLGFINLFQVARMFKELNNYRVIPRVEQENIEEILETVKESDMIRVSKNDFVELCLAVAVKFDKADEPTILETYLPDFYNSKNFIFFSKFVKSSLFNAIICAILLINGIVVAVESTLDLEDVSSYRVWLKFEMVFGWIYVLEMFFKVTVYGIHNYWKDYSNRFSFVLTWFTLIGETLILFYPTVANETWMRYVLIAQSLRLTRFLLSIPRYQTTVSTFLRLLPTIAPLFGILFCIICLFSMLGVHLFGGLMYTTNPVLEGTTFLSQNYFCVSFNDFSSGLVVLFNLSIVNNWYVWVDGYTAATGSSFTQLFFIIYYFISVVLILNLIAAFVLDAFFKEKELQVANLHSNRLKRNTSLGVHTTATVHNLLLHFADQSA